MKNSQQLRQEIAAEQAKADAIVALATEENRELTSEESTEIDAILGSDSAAGRVTALNTQLVRQEKLEARIQANLGRDQDNVFSGTPEIRVPARARKSAALKAFSNDSEGEKDAYASGQFLLATLNGSNKAKQWCNEHGIAIRNAMSEGDDMKGGVLVPPQFESAIINLKESYGVFGQNTRTVPMTSDTASIPRRLSGLTAYAVSEAQEITASDATMNQVNLVARKWATLTRISSELSEDAIISIADFLAQEIAYAHAVKEDACGFLGDGTTTYHGIMGLANALAAGSVSTATSTTIGALTLTEANAVVAKLPQYPGIMPKWFVNSALFWNGLSRLQSAAGGNTIATLASGPQLQFLGFPVVFTQTLSAAGTTGTVWGYFGDLSMGTTRGQRRGITISADGSRYFEYDQVAIRSTLRYDIVVHETGTASAAGPVIQCKLG